MKLEILLSESKKIYNTKELMSLGLTYYKINQMVKSEVLLKLNKSYFENNNYAKDDNDFYYVTAYAPDGVICLMSAAVYYNLITFRPDSINVAVPKNRKITTLPDWPVIKLYYFDGFKYQIGIDDIIIGENGFRIYNIDKTVADIIYYRNKVGIDETKEILINYLGRKDRNLNRLIKYSKQLKCYDILTTYLEVLL